MLASSPSDWDSFAWKNLIDGKDADVYQPPKGKSSSKHQAEQLCSDNGVDIEKMDGGIEALQLFQQFLSN